MYKHFQMSPNNVGIQNNVRETNSQMSQLYSILQKSYVLNSAKLLF